MAEGTSGRGTSTSTRAGVFFKTEWGFPAEETGPGQCLLEQKSSQAHARRRDHLQGDGRPAMPLTAIWQAHGAVGWRS